MDLARNQSEQMRSLAEQAEERLVEINKVNQELDDRMSHELDLAKQRELLVFILEWGQW